MAGSLILSGNQFHIAGPATENNVDLWKWQQPMEINSHRHLQCHTIHRSVLHLYLPASQLRRRVLHSVHTTATEVTKLL